MTDARKSIYTGIDTTPFLVLPAFSFPEAERTCRWLLDALHQARERWSFELWAYVIMPEHAHVLLWPWNAEPIEEIRKHIKQSTARRAIAHIRAHAPHWLQRIAVARPKGRVLHHFWQPGGGYDRNLWREDAVWTAIEYIHANPVRRGLCASPTDWEWSSARWFAEMTPVALAMDGPPPVATPIQWTRRQR